MTQEEKAKAYDKAIKVAQRFYNNSVAITKKGLEDIFPELRESEDEKKLVEWSEDLEEAAKKEAKRWGPKNFIYRGWLEYCFKAGARWYKEHSMLNKIMDYEKAYKEAVLKIQEVAYSKGGLTLEKLEAIFPELKESEDEKIRNELLDVLKKSDDSLYLVMTPLKRERFIAYLERRGEQKPIYKVEPKFREGEWITDGQLTCKVLSITGKSYELHLYNDDYCHFETDVQRVDKQYHLWNIQDAKEGDVLHSTGFHSDCVFIFKGLDNWKFDEPNGDRAVATGYCCLFVSADNMEFGIQGPDCIEVNTVKPATKIQRDLLFQKMKEAGYEWDAISLKLNRISQRMVSAEAKEAMYNNEEQ